ncbi:hypothetical protein LIER_08285 [Lithospermum erythrorhizon]|uniref:Late embryogenesis abundant protein LEA-2 subgroup domain-containing protein n=1 Tax=Lithospermum erythrorhizon TaxID=34254 RepID=A0AAV3PBK5_LITER
MAYQNQPSTGYPAPNYFSQPPPPPPPPPSTIFLRRIFAIICTIIIITCAIILIVWLALRPHFPRFSVNSFSIATPFNLTQDHLTTSWDVGFTVSNPNGKSNVYYDDIQGVIIYNGDWMGFTSMSPFVQGTKSSSLINASFVALDMLLEPEDVNVMNEERERNNGNLGFNILVLAEVKFKAGIWRVGRKLLRVSCEGLVISVDGNGTISNGLSGGPKQCIVG